MIINLWVIFLTGLTVGGLTCLAVQGGLLASVITAREDETTTNKGKHAIYATSIFLIAKFIAYILLGFVLGAFGSAINISDRTQTIMQFVAGLYMIAVALNLLDIHPIFRYAIIQPPKFLTRFVRNQSKSKDIFAPAFLGAMTIFIPCGTTLAMETLAISSANPFMGASIMAAYIIGTVPAFLGIGVITSLLGEKFKSHFLRIAAVAIIYLGFTSIIGAVTASGILTNQSSSAPKSSEVQSKNVENISQDITIKIGSLGYSPDYIKVKSGSPVNVTLVGVNAYSCASAFRIPSLRISKNLGPTDTVKFSFTPKSKGEIPFTCSMGMYTGVFDVI